MVEMVLMEKDGVHHYLLKLLKVQLLAVLLTLKEILVVML